MHPYKKIAIIGNAGSGKTTLSKKIAQITDLPLKHLDRYFWKPNWQEPNRKEFKKTHDLLCDQGEWIIEGISTKTAQYRFERADVIIFLDTSKWTCLYRISKRACINWNQEICAPGCKERGPTLKFLSFIWNFNKNRRQIILDMLPQYSNNKVKIIKTKNDENQLLKLLDNLNKKK